MKVIFLLCLLLYPFIGYAQPEIDLSGNLSNHQEVALSKIASKVDYIPLETTDDCLLSNELQIHWGKKDIFVGDIKMMKFYRFDKSGKLLNVIGERGDGPEAYPNAISFYVDENEESVYIIGTRTQTLYKYTYSGDFQKKISMGINSWTISLIDKNIVGYNNRYNRIKNQKDVYELYLFDSNGKELAKTPTTVTSEKDDMILFQLPFFYKYNNKVFYKNAVSEYVYQIGNDLSMHPQYKIMGGGNTQSANSHKDIQKYTEKVSVSNIFECNAWILISYVYQNKLEYLMYDKQKKTYTNVRYSSTENGFKDDLAGGPVFQPFNTGTSDGSCLLSLLTVEKALETNIASLKKLAADDNPVLVIATLK